MSKFIKLHLDENKEIYINTDMVTEIQKSNYGTYISLYTTGHYVSETPEEILMMIDVDLSNECVVCGEYHDYHCEKFCTIIRNTIKELDEYYSDAIPVEFIRKKMDDLKGNADVYAALDKLISDWTDWMVKRNGDPEQN